MTARRAKLAYKKIGPDLVQKVATTYARYVETPNATNKKNYLTWRLRIHLRCNTFMRRELQAVNEHFNLGLDDTDAGQLMWDFVEG